MIGPWKPEIWFLNLNQQKKQRTKASLSAIFPPWTSLEQDIVFHQILLCIPIPIFNFQGFSSSTSISRPSNPYNAAVSIDQSFLLLRHHEKKMTKKDKEEERIEKIIRGLLKLPENRRCINCNSLVISPSLSFLFFFF